MSTAAKKLFWIVTGDRQQFQRCKQRPPLSFSKWRFVQAAKLLELNNAIAAFLPLFVRLAKLTWGHDMLCLFLIGGAFVAGLLIMGAMIHQHPELELRDSREHETEGLDQIPNGSAWFDSMTGNERRREEVV